MLVLVIDTSSAAVTAAIVDVGDDVRLLVERVTINSRGHGELLAPSIADCLTQVGCAPADLGAIVAGLGPGPFTGLRVGLVTAAVFADTLARPSYGVCSLDAIAPDDVDGEVIVAADARRKEVYWARYSAGGERIDGPSVSRPDEIPLGGARAMAGAGARLYADRLGLPVVGNDHPSALSLVARAADRIRAGASSEPLTPLYLRRPDAVANPTVKPVSQ